MADQLPPPVLPPIPDLPVVARVTLRLYIARSTPNSVRAEQNLRVALDGFERSLVPPDLEIVDVFSQPKRAIIDGVVVTPTLIGAASGTRIVLIGDLADRTQLRQMLEELAVSEIPPPRVSG